MEIFMNSIPNNWILYDEDEEAHRRRLFSEIVALSWDESSDDELPASFSRETGSEPVYGVPAIEVYGFPASDFYQDAVNDPVMGFPMFPYARFGIYEQPVARHLVLSEIMEDHFRASARDQVNGEQTASPPVMSHQNPNEHFRITEEKAKTIACITKVVAVWLIVFATMLNGPDHESGILQMGMGSSILLQPNRFYIDSITVKQVSKNGAGPILYGFKNQPSLNAISNWSVKQYVSLQVNTHKVWRYFLNVGSKITISYSIPSSSKLVFTIAKGRTGYSYGESRYDQSSPNATLYWTIIQGNGLIQQIIPRSGKYIIAVENLNSEVEEVQLNISAKALLYNTSEASYMCRLGQSNCVFPLFFLEKRRAVLTTPLKQGAPNGQWYVTLTYGPRWTTFFGVTVVIIGIMLVGIELWKRYRATVDHEEHLD